MPIDRCSLCGTNIEAVPTLNGGRMICNYMPGHIVPGEGPDKGYRPRDLSRVDGTLLNPVEARDRLNKGDKTIVQVWLVHEQYCPKRAPAPPTPPPAEPRTEEQTCLF